MSKNHAQHGNAHQGNGRAAEKLSLGMLPGANAGGKHRQSQHAADGGKQVQTEVDQQREHGAHDAAGVAAGFQAEELVEDQHADAAGKVAQIGHQKGRGGLGAYRPYRAQQVTAEAEQHGKASLPLPASGSFSKNILLK